jgi:hypothetical protein
MAAEGVKTVSVQAQDVRLRGGEVHIYGVHAIIILDLEKEPAYRRHSGTVKGPPREEEMLCQLHEFASNTITGLIEQFFGFLRTMEQKLFLNSIFLTPLRQQTILQFSGMALSNTNS